MLTQNEHPDVMNFSPHQPPTKPTNWWQRRSKLGKILIGGGGALLAIGVIGGALSDKDDTAAAEDTEAPGVTAEMTAQVTPATEVPAMQAPTTVAPALQAPTTAAAPSMTVSQQNALESAESYLNYTAFSRQGLIDQLEFEKFSTADATWAVDQLTTDWNEQAALSAQSYLDYSSFSRQGLIDQLIFENFTPEQATYGVNQVGL